MPEPPGQRQATWRCFFSLAILLVLAALLIQQLQRLAVADIIHPKDFVQYWAAGKLNLNGENPYDRQAIFAIEQQVGKDTIDFLNPPVTLALAMPLALVPYQVSRFVFLFLQLMILAGSALWAWRLVAGETGYFWLALLIFLTFWPNIMTIIFGQITPILLVAVLGFLHLQRLQKDFWAGLAASLLTIKPHLLYLFWLALLLWSCHGRHWRTLAGLALGTFAMLAIALAANPRLLEQYLTFMDNFWPQDHYLVPALGSWLRLAGGWEHRWLQNIPAVLGSVWLVSYFYRRPSAKWNWDREMPLLILVSCVTTIYGGWISDLVVLILPVMQLFVWTVKENNPYRLGWLIAGFILLNFAWMKIRVILGDPWIGWTTPILLVVYVWFEHRQRRLQVQGTA